MGSSTTREGIGTKGTRVETRFLLRMIQVNWNPRKDETGNVTRVQDVWLWSHEAGSKSVFTTTKQLDPTAPPNPSWDVEINRSYTREALIAQSWERCSLQPSNPAAPGSPGWGQNPSGAQCSTPVQRVSQWVSRNVSGRPRGPCASGHWPVWDKQICQKRWETYWKNYGSKRATQGPETSSRGAWGAGGAGASVTHEQVNDHRWLRGVQGPGHNLLRIPSRPSG